MLFDVHIWVFFFLIRLVLVIPRDFLGELQENRHLCDCSAWKRNREEEKGVAEVTDSHSGKLQLVLQLDIFEAWESYSSLEQGFF